MKFYSYQYYTNTELNLSKTSIKVSVYLLLKKNLLCKHTQFSRIKMVCLNIFSIKISVIVEYRCFNYTCILIIFYNTLSLKSKMSVTRTRFLLVVKRRIQSRKFFVCLSFKKKMSIFY